MNMGSLHRMSGVPRTFR